MGFPGLVLILGSHRMGSLDVFPVRMSVGRRTPTAGACGDLEYSPLRSSSRLSPQGRNIPIAETSGKLEDSSSWVNPDYFLGVANQPTMYYRLKGLACFSCGPLFFSHPLFFLLRCPSTEYCFFFPSCPVPFHSSLPYHIILGVSLIFFFPTFFLHLLQ